MNSVRTRFGVLVLAGCLTASLLQARVFTEGRLDLLNPATFGRLIYKTLMELNGGKAEVSVVACADGPALVEAAAAAPRDPTLQAVALSAGEDKPALLVTVVQSPSEKAASHPSRARHRLGDVPLPSDGVVLGTIKSVDTRTTLERLASRQGAAEVERFFERAMGQAGWSRLVEAAGGSGFQFYVKGADVCVVLVTTQESNGETGITLLHKQGAVN